MRPEDYQQARCPLCGSADKHAPNCAAAQQQARAMQNADPYGPFQMDQYSPFNEQTQRLNWYERQRGLTNANEMAQRQPPPDMVRDEPIAPEPPLGLWRRFWRWIKERL